MPNALYEKARWCRILDLAVGPRARVFNMWKGMVLEGSTSRWVGVSSSRFMLWDFWDLWFRVQGLRLRFWRIRVRGVGFRVYGI